MAYIYKITNQVNGKVYIGKTTELNIKNRWREHLSERHREESKDRPFYRALNKYGPENFTIEEVEQCDFSILEEREIYWIAYYRAYVGWDDCSGYNATLGGDGKILYDYNAIVEQYRQLKTVKNVAQQFGMDEGTVRRALKNANIDPLQAAQENIRHTQRKRCCMYDKSTLEPLKQFDTLSDAGRYLITKQISSDTLCHISSRIGQVCNGKRKTAYGYIWKFIEK